MNYTDAVRRGLQRKNGGAITANTSYRSGSYTNAVLTGLERRKKKEEEERKNAAEKAIQEEKAQTHGLRDPFGEEITPVEERSNTWFKSSGLWEDGYQIGDISRTLLGSLVDVGENIGAGVIGMGEKAVDALAFLAPYAEQTQLNQAGYYYNMDLQKQKDALNKQSKQETAAFVSRDLYNEEKIAKALISDPARDLGIDAEAHSVFGQKTDSLAQSAGQLLGTMGLQAAGLPWWVTSGAMSFGSETENALNSGADYDKAGVSAAISAGAEILTEKLFGGSGLGETGLINIEGLTRGISNKLVKAMADYGIDMLSEGAEEVVSQLASNLGSALYREDSLKELLASEEAIEGYIDSFIGGAALGGVMNAAKFVGSAKKGTDYRSDFTRNEQKVVDKVYAEKVAQAKKDSKNGKVSLKKLNEIYDSVQRELEKGFISTDTIEEVLGGEAYTELQKTAKEEAQIRKEYEELGQSKDFTLADRYRYEELRDKVKHIDSIGKQEYLKNNLRENVMQTVKGDRLMESYNERARRGKAFEADLSQYDAKQRAVVENAVNSGILNNTNRTHEFVDLVAKISADKGVNFDFTNNERLKESGFAIEGKTVNGYVNENGVTLNIQSAKALNTTVGHEITHVLEGTELYQELQDSIIEYAKAKGDYQGRYDTLTEIYKDIEGADINGELTADLVGDYLFTDSDFIRNLSVNHRNVFQKIFDEVKYLCRVATAGSKEARELERVKKLFEEAYRSEGKRTIVENGVRYALANIESVTPNEEQRTKNIHEVAEMESVYTVDESKLVPGEKSIKEIYQDTFSGWGGNIHSDIFGDIAVRNSSIRSEMRHGSTPVKVASIEAIPSVIQNGKIVEWIQKGTELFRIVVAAPIKIGDTPYYMGVMLQRDTQNQRLYLHDVVIEKEASDLSQEHLDSTGPHAENENLYTSSILDKIIEVKRNMAGDAGNQSAEVTDAQNEAGLDLESETQFSLSRNTEYMDKAISANESSMMVDPVIMTEAEAVRARVADRMNAIKDRGLVGLPEDIEGNTYIANSSYDGTEENTTICPRSLAAETFVDAVSEYLGRPLSVEEQIYISQDLQGRSLTPECTYCYVATDRKAYRAFLGEYINQRDAVIDKLRANPGADISRSGELYKEFLNGRKDTAPMYKRFKMWTDAYRNGTPMIDASHLANINKLMGDINSEFGAELKPQIADAMKYAQSASWAKKRVNYVAYNGHILKWKPDRIKKLNSHYGLRMYSFSDFHPAFVLENMQMITDASVKGLKMLGYTKDTDFVEIFAPSGMNINVSTFGFETGGGVFENNLIGAEWEKAKQLREQYPNVGITFVATSDTLVDWALNQDWIDVVIPYHLVRTGTEVAKAFGYKNYTSESSDTKSSGWAKGNDKKYIAPTEHNNDKAAYLAALEKNHLKPRFERFIEHPNYMKLVNECRQPASQSKPVQPVFDEDAAMVALAKLEANGYYQPVGGSVDRMYEIAAEVAENMTETLPGVEKNEGWVRDLPMKQSLSEEGAKYEEYGDYNVYGDDVMLAPVAENATTAVDDDIAPALEEEIPADMEERKTALDEEFDRRREELSDKNAFISRIASDLYKEIKNLKKGVKASDMLGELLDYGYEWSAIRSALVNIKHTPDRRVNENSAIESIARQMMDEEYENRLYDLEEEYQEQLKNLKKDAQSEAKGGRIPRKVLHQNIMDQVKGAFASKGYDFDQVLKKAANLSTFSTVDNTPQRVMEKALGYKEGQILADLTVNKVAQNESNGIKWLNSFTDRKNGLLAQISKQYHIKPGSKESAAAQMYAEGFYVAENNDIIAYGDAELAADFPNPEVQANIKGLARDPRIRQVYDETLDAINESRVRNSYPEIPRLDNYFLHFRAMEDTFSKLGLPFNPNDIRAKDLPTDLNGVTADLKPGQPFFASAMHREGKRTSFDLLGGLEKYLGSAKNQIYHIDDIQILRALRNYIAQTFGQAEGLSKIDEMSEEEAAERIKEVYSSHLSTFAKFLNEEANVLAGKTALIDRGLEGIIGRRGITFLNTLNRQVGSNKVGYNISSSLTNFLAPVQAFAKTNKFDFIKGFAQTVANRIGSLNGNGDDFAQESPVMIRRKGAENFYRTPWQMLSDPGYALMSWVDDISTEMIARAKYNEFTRKGMDTQTAHYETDKWVSRLMGDRSLGQQPQLYNSKMLGIITKFQLEVRNQLDSQFYDTIQEAKVSTEDIQNGLARNAVKAAKIASTFTQLAVLQHLFGSAFESVAGYNPAFDIIEVIIKTFGWDDDEEDEDAFLDNIEEGFFALMDDMPYVSTMTGGRIPMASALPIAELYKGTDQYGNEKSRWETLVQAAPYWFLPGGYGQIKKTMQGLGMFNDDLPIAGSYTNSGKLRFPVEDNPANRVQAALFGQYASENARDYFDNERSALGEEQIKEFLDLDIPIRDYWEYREGLKGLEDLGEKADYIYGLDLPIDKKNLLINNLTDRKEPIDLAGYGTYEDFEEFDFAEKHPDKYAFLKREGVSYDQYSNFSELTKKTYDWAFDNPEKYDFLKENGVTLERYRVFSDETKAAYNWAYENQESVPLAKAIGGIVEYREIAVTCSGFNAKDENGNSVSGLKKQRVKEYIYSLDLPDVKKHILFKSQYPSDDSHNYEIIEYLNGRDDISYDEMVLILKKLDFEVDSEGNISW